MATRTEQDTARRIVSAIVEDLKDRRGLRQEWEQIDAGIRIEILDRWWELACEQLEGK